MIEFTQNFVFTWPFDPNNHTNKLKSEVKAIADRVYTNQSLLNEVDHFKQLFTNKKECLIHANLHTGEFKVNDGDVKVNVFFFAIL